jgi:hypothetical protein
MKKTAPTITPRIAKLMMYRYLTPSLLIILPEMTWLNHSASALKEGDKL